VTGQKRGLSHWGDLRSKSKDSITEGHTFWIARQPYVCNESFRTLPSIVFARSFFCCWVPNSKSFWMT
jgi:hypothetical protein